MLVVETVAKIRCMHFGQGMGIKAICWAGARFATWDAFNVWIRSYVDEVVIGCGGEVIVRHPHCYDRAEMVFDLEHYLLPLVQLIDRERRMIERDQGCEAPARRIRGQLLCGSGN